MDNFHHVKPIPGLGSFGMGILYRELQLPKPSTTIIMPQIIVEPTPVPIDKSIKWYHRIWAILNKPLCFKSTLPFIGFKS